MANSDTQILVLTNLPTTADALHLARQLVAKRLAACVNLLPPMTSVYQWQGRMEQAGEQLLLIKTTTTAYAALEAEIKQQHPYELPEIIAVPIVQGLKAYLDWIQATTDAH